jgi:hypothetical protein
MEKRAHQYKLTLTYIKTNKEEDPATEPIELNFENHDDIGLKLFSEVMLKNRNHPLFEEFLPAFGVFMKKLKGKL